MAIVNATVTISGVGGLSAVAPVRPTFNLVTTYASGPLRADFSGDVGLIFTPSVTSVFNQIGCLCPTNPSGNRTLRMWNVTGGSAVISTTINLTGCTPGYWYYVPITQITLNAGNSYYIGCSVALDGQFWPNTSLNPSTLRNTTSFMGGYSGGAGAPSNQAVNSMFFGVELNYVGAAETASAQIAGAGR